MQIRNKSFKKRFRIVNNSGKRDKDLCEFFEFYKTTKIKNKKFDDFHKKLNYPKIICSINMGRSASQFFFENLNKKLNLICAPNLFNSRSKTKYAKHKNFEEFFFYSLNKINYNNVIFFEISPKRFLKLINFLEKKTQKKFNYHFIFSEDVVRQTFSFFIAMSTNIWNNFSFKDRSKLSTKLNYSNIRIKLKEILKNIIFYEKKIFSFLKNYKYINQKFENIIKNSSKEEKKFVEFYSLNKKLLKKNIKNKNYIKKNRYDNRYKLILKEFRNDITKNSILKKRISLKKYV